MIKKYILVNRFANVFGVDALVKASGVILLPLYLKLMSQDEYSTFSYLLSIVGVFALVFNFGLYVAQTKMYLDSNESEKGSTIFTINVVLILLLAVSMLIIYSFNIDYLVIKKLFSEAYNYEKYRFVILFGILISVYSCMLFYFFMAREEILKAQIYNFSRFVLGSILMLGSIYFLPGDKSSIRFHAYFLAEFISFSFFILFYLSCMKKPFNSLIAIKALKIAIPIMASSILGILINFSDKFFLLKFCSTKDLAIYFVSFTYANIVSIVFSSFQNVWLPIFLKEKNEIRGLFRTKKNALILLFLLFILSVFIWIFVFTLIYYGYIDVSYHDVAKVLPIMLVSSLLAVLSGMLSNFTIYWNITYLTIIFGLIASAVSIPMNMFGAKYYGVYGVSIASVFTNATYVLLYYLTIKFRKIII
jgi:O-antigen/teichoic acid export membrane protein